MNDARFKVNDSDHKSEFKFEMNQQQLGNALQGGLDAIEKVFAGFVKTIKEAVGPETLRNLEVGSWLEQLATCLDQISAGLRESGAVPAGKSGELSFYLEQWDSQIAGSKFESQSSALRQRLDLARQAVDRASAGIASHEAVIMAETAGYFHAAAKTAVPFQIGDKSS